MFIFYASYFALIDGNIIRWSLTKFQDKSVVPEYALKGNAAENKKIPTYAPAQDHYGDCIQGLIFFVTDS